MSKDCELFGCEADEHQECPECGGSGLITSGTTYGGHEEFVGCPFCIVRGEV